MYALAQMPSFIELTQPLDVKIATVQWGFQHWDTPTVDEARILHDHMKSFHFGPQSMSLPAGMVFTIVRRPIIFRDFQLELRYNPKHNKLIKLPFKFHMALNDSNFSQPLFWKPYTP
jgi:hypothetical protein